MNQTNHALELAGLDGSNPLAFLAALGTLYLLNRRPSVVRDIGPSRLSWQRATLTPVLHFNNPVEPPDLATCLVDAIREDFSDNTRPSYLYNDIIAVEPDKFRAVLVQAIDTQNETALDLVSGFGSDAVVQTQGKKAGCIEPSEISFSNGQSMRYLLDAYAELVCGLSTKSSTYPPIDPAKIADALFAPWSYTDDHKELRWDPTELRLGATPSQARGTVIGANVLAFWAFALLRSMPTADGLRTVGVHQTPRNRQRRTYFLMPHWLHPATFEVARALIENDSLRRYAMTSASLRPARLRAEDVSDFDRQHGLATSDLRSRGIARVFTSEIITEMKANYFTPSFEL